MPLPAILAQLRKRPRESEVQSSSNGTANNSDARAVAAAPRHIVHYDDMQPIPFVMDDAFPSEPYRSRHDDVKTAIHWGQRKLLLSELQLLTHYAKRGVSYHIVYAGSAPGTHLGFLDELTNCIHTWELVDPGQFDRAVLGVRRNFLLRNEFFTNATAYGINATRLAKLPALRAVYEHIAVDECRKEKSEIHARLDAVIGHLDVARGTTDIPSIFEEPLLLPPGLEMLCQVAMERKPLLFVSDIRSGSVDLPNFEEHVAENMKAQQTWTEILQGDFAMLKFRLPYTSKATGPCGEGAQASTLIDADGCVSYLDGDMVLPIWTRPTSTEGRLVVPRGARRKRYNVRRVEDQFFFFNAKLREEYHFNHILSPHSVLDGHFDAAAEINSLSEYCIFMEPKLASSDMRSKLVASVSSMVDRISVQLKLDFASAIRRRDAIVMKQAKLGIRGADDADADDDDGHPTALRGKEDFVPWDHEAQRMIDRATQERLRIVWWSNLTGLSTPAAEWRAKQIPRDQQ